MLSGGDREPTRYRPVALLDRPGNRARIRAPLLRLLGRSRRLGRALAALRMNQRNEAQRELVAARRDIEVVQRKGARLKNTNALADLLAIAADLVAAELALADGRRDEARRCYREALRLRPAFAEARRALARLEDPAAHPDADGASSLPDPDKTDAPAR